MANIVLPFVTTFNDKGVKQGQASLASLAKSSLAGAVSVGVVVDQLGKAVRAAAEDQKAQEQLELAVRNNTDANTAQIQAMEDTIGRMEMQKAVADDELRPALGNLVRATGDVTKAQDLLNLALDISSATGRDLQTVTLALSKAQTGQIGALTRLGIPLDAAAVKSKDLDAIQADLAARFAGASDAAAASADGGMKKLQIALDNTYEAVGYRLLPVLGDYVTVLGDLASKALDAEKNNNGFFEAFVFGFKTVFPMVRAVELLNKVVGNQADELTNARGKQYDYTNINQRMNMGLKELTVTTDENTKSQKKANDAKDKARQKAKAYADTLRERVKTALDNSNDALEKAQGEFDDYKNSLAGAITGLVSLADAVRTQETAESALQESLKDRANAYAALNRLDPTNDAESYAEALDKVAEAEKAVGAAQVARSKADYTKVFRQQIADAQTFSNHLQILAPYLDQFGMAQLINLGPSAGVQVTRDMINGVDGFTVDAYKQSLSSLSASGQALGMSGAGYLFGGNLAGAQNAQGQVNQYSITVNAGLVSNPAQVGRDIIEAIKSAERVSGTVFVSV
jgi:tetratricopeptide (TPR) repeat protein